MGTRLPVPAYHLSHVNKMVDTILSSSCYKELPDVSLAYPVPVAYPQPGSRALGMKTSKNRCRSAAVRGGPSQLSSADPRRTRSLRTYGPRAS